MRYTVEFSKQAVIVTDIVWWESMLSYDYLEVLSTNADPQVLCIKR